MPPIVWLVVGRNEFELSVRKGFASILDVSPIADFLICKERSSDETVSITDLQGVGKRRIH